MILLKLIAAPVHARTLALIALGELILLLFCSGLSWGVFALWPLGLFAWTLLEYLLHRFVFHLPLSHPLRFLGATLHAQHHQRPNEPPITKPPALTLGAFFVVSLVGWLTFGPSVFPLVAGMVAGYLFYEMSHIAAHTLLPSEHPLPSFQASHLAHHQDPLSRFGITSPLWDYLFGSLGK